ncbi:MAG: T9SS type A sorting domain-containing protein [Candidatus Kapaibacterium sp.]
MKKLTTLVFAAVLIFNTQMFSQTGLLVTDYDYSNYPKVTLEYYVFKNAVNQNSTLNANDIVILNNDISITDKKISCDNNVDLNENSVLVSIDLAINNSNFNFDSVLSATDYLQFNTPNSEFALSSFSTVNHLNYDFVQTFSSFNNELLKLKSSDKSRIDSVFYSLPVGSNTIFQTANPSNAKHIVIYTDKRSSINIEHLNKLKADGVKLYLVVIDNIAVKDVKIFFEKNDGFFVFENVSKSNLKLVTLAIKELINGNNPCTLTYTSTIDCDTSIIANISIPSISVSKEFQFEVSSTLIPRLALAPSYYGFSSVLPGSKKEADIVITAVNSDISIDSIYFSDDKNGVFKFISGKISSPQILSNGNNWTIKIEYAPNDSNIVFTKLVIASDACLNEEVLITGGFPNTPPVVKNIEIVSPNKCDEKLIVGDNYKVTWSGLLPSDVIQLEYSTDNGNKWDTLASNVTDLKYEWTIPDVESEDCLVRGIQLWPNNIGRTLDLVHPEAVNTAFFDHVDGSKAITSCDDGGVRLWNTNTGKLVRHFKKHTKEVNYAVFSPDDSKIASASNDTSVILWDSNNDSNPLKIIENHNDVIRSVNFNPAGTEIISVDKSGVCKIFDVASGNELHSFSPDGTKPLWFGDYHPLGNYYLTGGNGGRVKVWDAKTNDFVKEFVIAGWVSHFAINSDGSRLLIVDILRYEITVWDFNTNTKLFTLKHNSQSNRPLNSGSFNDFNGQEYILTSGDDYTAIMWNSDGDSINVYKEHTNSVRTANFNFDGQRVITSSWDKTAKIWNLDERDLQMDTSDCVFTITKLKFDKNSLDFGDTYLGDYKDTIFSEALINLNNFQFPIRNAFLRGANINDFEINNKLINTIVDTLLTNKSVTLDVRFKPTDLGIRKAELVLDIPGNQVVIPIQGNCTKRDLEIVEGSIVFDKVDIGDFRDKVVDVIVRNNSNRDLVIDSIYIDIPRSNDYSIVMENLVTELKSGKELGIIARFAPQFIDRSNADIVFIHNGNNSPTRISLFGSGSIPVFDTTTVSISDIEASSNNRVIAKINITELKPELKNDEFRGITFDLSFNSTLLYPDFSYSSDEIVDRIRTVRVEMDAQDNWFAVESKENRIQANEIEIAELQFRTALGNDSTSMLNINGAKVLGKAKLKIFESDGNFRLLDLCTEGGARLFDASDKFNLETPNPNPLVASTYINYELLDDGNIELDVIDYTGNRLLRIDSGYKAIGKYSASLDINRLPSGLYFIRLQTQTQNIVRKIQIER